MTIAPRIAPTYLAEHSQRASSLIRHTSLMGQVLQLFDEEQAPKPATIPNNKAEIIVGDVRRVLKGFPDQFCRTCVTSPPYWGLRDYGAEGQIGAESDVRDYIKDLVSVFREVRRVLEPVHK